MRYKQYPIHALWPEYRRYRDGFSGNMMKYPIEL